MHGKVCELIDHPRADDVLDLIQKRTTVSENEIHAGKGRMKRPFNTSDSPDHFLRLKGTEYLNFMADIYNTPLDGRSAFIENYAKRFGIYDSLNSTILSYSHGMRQKIMIMGALIHNPSVWILDEPLTGLDPQSAFELKQMMREHVKKGNSVFFSTHVLEVAEKLCDEICIIKKGELLYCGTLDELRATHKSNASLENIFLELTETKE